MKHMDRIGGVIADLKIVVIPERALSTSPYGSYDGLGNVQISQ